MAVDIDYKQQVPEIINSVLVNGMDLSGIFGDSVLGRNLGNMFSSGISTASSNIAQNIFKGESLTQGLGQDVGQSIAGTAAGLAGYGIGQGINALGGNSKLSRGLGAGVASGIGNIGGTVASNLLKGNAAFQGFRTMKDATSAYKAYQAANVGRSLKSAADAAQVTKEAGEAAKAARMAAISNIAGVGMSAVGAGLQAALGPSKEYGGKYGNITQTMDTVYDLAQMGVGFVPGVGTAISGAMALNKGLSNLFGSTDGMTRTDAILGSAFMPAPVKWLNMWGANTTDTFKNQSWQNTQKTNAFMGNAFGNLGEKFDKAREEAGKTYGTFSYGAYRKAQDNLSFANKAWDKILAMTDQNELQKIRSQYMTSINNQRYAQNIQGGWSPLQRGKYGMKILNNATNHNIGMRLLSGAALIDNKQMILCNVPD